MVFTTEALTRQVVYFRLRTQTKIKNYFYGNIRYFLKLIIKHFHKKSTGFVNDIKTDTLLDLYEAKNSNNGLKQIFKVIPLYQKLSDISDIGWRDIVVKDLLEKMKKLFRGWHNFLSKTTSKKIFQRKMNRPLKIKAKIKKSFELSVPKLQFHLVYPAQRMINFKIRNRRLSMLIK